MLKVLSKRQDNYHNLVTLYQLLSWGDRVSISPASRDTYISVTGPYADQVPQGDNQQDNLAWRAWHLMAKELSCLNKKINIELHKNIPAGSGLGGGSSNAATLMRMLRLLWRPDMPLDDLADMGSSLGADVPVFIHGRSALASGVGDKLVPVILPQNYYLIFCPDIHSSTALLFGDLAKERQGHQSDYDDAEVSITQEIKQDNMAWLEMDNPNDFLSYALQKYPPLKNSYDNINSLTPNKLGDKIFLSGTGSSMFAVYDDKDKAYLDQQQLTGQVNCILAENVL